MLDSHATSLVPVKPTAIVPYLLSYTGDAAVSGTDGEQRIVGRLKELCSAVRLNEDELMRRFIEQGDCIMSASDFIKAAGGIEKWLAQHGLELGISGKSHTIADNAVHLARAGYAECKRAVDWARAHPDRMNTNRLSGLAYFVVALRAYKYRNQTMMPNPQRRPPKSDREKSLIAKLSVRNDWLYRLLADLEGACREGWNRRVLNAIRSEMEEEHSAADAEEG